MLAAIGSKNKAKASAVQRGFKEAEIEAEFIFVQADSGVSEQPFSDEETVQGAVNRAEGALGTGEAQIGIGLEGGVVETPAGLFLCNWGALAETGKPTLVAGGARILLPEAVAFRLRNGEELGPVMDEYCQRENIRSKEGAIGVFTNGLVTREEMFLHVTKLLLGQWQYKR
ncbi:MAG TPA: DUF84 family protein [Chondromyces sp.]|nr:DUF84 family protein [Chondromyces sp.]